MVYPPQKKQNPYENQYSDEHKPGVVTTAPIGNPLAIPLAIVTKINKWR